MRGPIKIKVKQRGKNLRKSLDSIKNLDIFTGTLDSDGILVLYIQDKEAQTITFTASKEGYEDVSKTIRLTGLTLEEEE